MAISSLPSSIRIDDFELRLPDRRDTAELVRGANDPEISRWTPLPHPYTTTDAEAFVDRSAEWVRIGDLRRTYVASSPEGVLFGMFGAVRVNEPAESAEIGYWVSAQARRRSIAIRSVRALAGALLDAGFQRIDAEVGVGNTASQSVLERAGFLHEGVLRSVSYHGTGLARHRIDVHKYSLIPSDAAAQQ